MLQSTMWNTYKQNQREKLTIKVGILHKRCYQLKF